MACAYSMTNQNLQNSISERAYLEKTNEELKVEGWGTTNIVYIGNESCDSILLVGVDSRATSGGEQGSITNDNTKKYFFMKSCNVFATKAGNSDHCMSMLNYVREYFLVHKKKIVNGIREAPTIAKLHIRDWKTYSELELFQGFIILAGYKDGIPYAYKVKASGESSKKSKSNICHGHVMGTGGKYVREYFKNCNMEEAQSSNEMLENMERALLHAALCDGRSGGNLLVFKVKQRGFDVLYDKSVLEALLDHYDVLKGYLSNSLFFLFHKRGYKYTHESNVKVHEGFEKQFKKAYVGNVFIKKGSKFDVRLVHFENPNREVYEKLERKIRRCKVPHEVQDLPHEVQDLPWVRIENFSRVLILCGMPTEEFVRNLQDL